MTAGFGLTQELPLALRPAFRESTAGSLLIQKLSKTRARQIKSVSLV